MTEEAPSKYPLYVYRSYASSDHIAADIECYFDDLRVMVKKTRKQLESLHHCRRDDLKDLRLDTKDTLDELSAMESHLADVMMRMVKVR